MRPFSYSRVKDQNEAVGLVAANTAASFLAGGTTLIDLMKLEVMEPTTLVDINRLASAQIEPRDGGLIIGALARNSDVAHHQLIQRQYPVLSEAFLSGASVQLRNMATVGGNLLQRSRCAYFRDPTMPCNKREPGTGCPAIDGHNRGHAIFGGSDHCVSVHPSDMCVALLALDAVIHIKGSTGDRTIPIKEFYREPGDHPEIENQLKNGELIVAVELPPSKFAAHSHYLKIRDRASFTFALVSVAACLDLAQGNVQDARIVIGGVGTKPWRVEASEKALIGKPLTRDTMSAAADAAIKGAQPLKYNKFKIELARRSVIRALETASAGKA